MRRVRWRALALILIVGVPGAMLLSGCGPIRYERPLPLSVHQSGHGMEVAVCEPISANRVFVGIRNEATDGDWLTLSDLRGSTVISSETVFKVGESLAGMSAVGDRTPPTPSDGEDVNVNIQDEDDDDGDDTLTVFFAQVPWSDLDGDWFFTDGGSSSDPCGHYRDYVSTH